MDIQIRELSGDEWRLWRSLRLRAVEESPNAFRGSLGTESAEADSHWPEMIQNTASNPSILLLVAEVSADPVGMLFGRVDEDARMLDIGSMWVDPLYRRNGIAASLLDTAKSWAIKGRATGAELWVTQGNEAAEGFFDSAGFVTTSESEPLREGSLLTVVRMTAEL